MFGSYSNKAKDRASTIADSLAPTMTLVDKTFREQLAFIQALQAIGKGEYDTSDPRFLIAQAHFLHALLAELLKDNRLPRGISRFEASNMLLTEYLLTRTTVEPVMADAIVVLVNDNMAHEVDAYSKMVRAARDALNDSDNETARMHFAIAIHLLITGRADADYDLKPCCFNTSATRKLSLQEFFATFGPQAQFTWAELRAQDDARMRAALLQSHKFSNHELKWEDLLAAREATHDLVLSGRPYELARAQENFLKAKSKAEEILAHHRSEGIVSNKSMSKRRWSEIREHSGRLYYAELTNNYKWHPIEKWVMNEIAQKMTGEFLHPNALSAVLADRRFQRNAKRKRRIKTARDFLFVQLPLGLRAFGIFVLFASPVVAALFYQPTLAHFDKMTYHLVSYVLLASSVIIGLYAMLRSSGDYNAFKEPEPSTESESRAWLIRREEAAEKRRRENEWKVNVAVGLFVVLLLIVWIMRND